MLERVSNHAFSVLALQREGVERRRVYAALHIDQRRGVALLIGVPEAVLHLLRVSLVSWNDQEA